MGFQFKEGIVESQFMREEYFPAVVIFDGGTECAHYVEMLFSDTDLIEFATDAVTGELRKIQIVLCNHFRIADVPLPVPSCSMSFIATVSLPVKTMLDHFDMTVFSDGLQVSLSEKAVLSYCRSGEVTFGLDENGDVAELFVVGLESADIAHVIAELQADMAG